jgi:micrococcal nuclease
MTPVQPGRTLATVLSVVDGDTIVVEMGGAEQRVRYIGIDTPETVHPSRPVQEFGLEASARNKDLVEGKQVWLEKDVSETDQFGRLLRYVWLDETTMVNAVLISEGLAQVSTFPPDVKHTDLFIQLQSEARESRAGMWVDFEPTPEGDNCDPAYPGVCIPPPPPDLNCSGITERRFQVLPPDPHHFDTDGDGVACES